MILIAVISVNSSTLRRANLFPVVTSNRFYWLSKLLANLRIQRSLILPIFPTDSTAATFSFPINFHRFIGNCFVRRGTRFKAGPRSNDSGQLMFASVSQLVVPSGALSHPRVQSFPDNNHWVSFNSAATPLHRRPFLVK